MDRVERTEEAETQRKAYAKPQLRRLGLLRELTQSFAGESGFEGHV